VTVPVATTTTPRAFYGGKQTVKAQVHSAAGNYTLHIYIHISKCIPGYRFQVTGSRLQVPGYRFHVCIHSFIQCDIFICHIECYIDKYKLYLSILSAVPSPKIRLTDLRPLPDVEQRVTKKRRNIAKHPSPHLTSAESMEFTRQKDRDFTISDLGPKLAVTPRRPRGRDKMNIPFSLPKPSLLVPKPDEKYRCSTCEQPSCAEYMDKWVECSECSALSHLTCLVSIGQLCNACSKPIYVKKTPKVPTKKELDL
jgi:hypothetical protein